MAVMTEFQLRYWVKNKLGSVLSSQIVERVDSYSVPSSSVDSDSWDSYDFAIFNLQTELNITLPTSSANETYNIAFYWGTRKALLEGVAIDYTLTAIKDPSGTDSTAIPKYLQMWIEQATTEYEKAKDEAFEVRSDGTDLEPDIDVASPTRKAKREGTAIDDIFPPDI